MAIDGLRFTHVAFRASDLERSIRWYEDCLRRERKFFTQSRKASGQNCCF